MTHNKINLHFSHSVAHLAELLAEKVNTQQAKGSVFDAPKVLVPNANMQRYLQLTMASLNGVCAHVDFPFLETGLFKTVNELLGSKFEHLNGAKVSWFVWRLLHDTELMSEAVYAPIKTYLGTESAGNLAATKRWQLSQKLAKLMLDYESQRPEMVDQWLQGQKVFSNSENHHLKQLEQMQQDLYVRLFKSQQVQTCLTLFQAALLLDKSDINNYNSAQTIHIFTPSRLSQLHRKLLLQLGLHMNIQIYSLNVCSEYWEDLQTEQEVRWQQSLLSPYKQHAVTKTDVEGQFVDEDHGGESFAELTAFIGENELLKAWGKPGREALKLFSDIEVDAIHHGIEYQDDWLVPNLLTADSLLKVVQSNVLNRSNELKQLTDAKHLNSVQFAVAPSVVREVEAVYNNILLNIQLNPDLALNDIAVLVTDMNQYRFVIEQVFEAFNHQHQIQLSYAIVDSSAAKESRYAGAVLDLFTVLDDDFIRASVFNWLDNPCVQAGNHFDGSDWHDWLMVVDHLGIYCGFSNLYPPESEVSMPSEMAIGIDKLYTWEQGLARLHQSLASGLVESEEMDVSALGAERIGQLSVLLETLHQYKVRLNQVQTAVQWEQQLNQMFDLLLAVPVDDQKEQNIQMALQNSLLQLAEAQPDLRLNFEDIKQFITHEIQQLPASKGSYLSGGVVCAALQPMRPIPFKITYILGLDEKSFPGQVRQETLDLTLRSRRIGDINPVENNNYLLLETLMCTREKLYLSYVGMDLLKDEVIEPSAALTTLHRYCESLIDFSALDCNELTIKPLPLNASEMSIFDSNQIKTDDWGVNYSYSDYLLMVDRNMTGLIPPRQSLSPAQRQIYQNIEAVKAQEQQTINTELVLQQEITDSNLSVAAMPLLHLDSRQLADYLSNPQSAVLKLLGVNNQHPDDRSLVDFEPDQLTPLIKHQIFTCSIEQWLLNPQTADLAQIVEQQHQMQLQLSQAPLPLFSGLAELSKVEDSLQKKLKSALADKQVFGALKVGQADSQINPDRSVNGVELTLQSGQKVQLNGYTDRLYHQDGYLTDQVVISSSKKNSQWNTKLLKPFIDWCLWQLSDQVQVAEVFHVHLVFPDKLHTFEFKPWHANGESFATRSSIENYLHELVTSLLEKPAQFLPSELLNQLKVPKKIETPEDIPFLKASSTAKDIYYLAYSSSDLTAEENAHINNKYAKQLQWPSYEEVLQVVEIRPSSDPLMAYRQNLLPLFAMVFGQFDDADKPHKNKKAEQGGHS